MAVEEVREEMEKEVKKSIKKITDNIEEVPTYYCDYIGTAVRGSEDRVFIMFIFGDKMTKEPLFKAVVPLEITEKFSDNLDKVIEQSKKLEKDKGVIGKGKDKLLSYIG